MVDRRVDKCMPVGMLCLFLGVCGCSGATSASNSAPATSSDSTPGSLVPRSPVWDLGDVEGGHTYSHVFELTNKSRNSVNIVSVVSTCGCIAAKPPGSTVAPGGTVNLPVSIALPREPGAFHRKIQLTTAGASREATLTLSVKGRCGASPALFVLPPRLDFGDVPVGSQQVREITVGRYDGSPVRFQGIDDAKQGVTLLNQSTGDSSIHNGVRLSLQLDPNKLSLGQNTLDIVVTTDAAEPFRTLMVPVFVRRKADKRLGFVSSLFLPQCERGKTLKCEIRDRRDSDSDRLTSDVKSCHFEGDERITARGDSQEAGIVLFDTAAIPEVPNGASQVIRGTLVVTSIDNEHRIPVTMVFN